MVFDLDPFDDELPNQPVARKVKFQPKSKPKFQPKSKSQPQKKEPAAASVSSSQAVQTIGSAQSELSDPFGTTKPSDHCSDVVANDNGGSHSSMEKSVGENADILIGLEALGDSLPQTTTNMECTDPPSEAVALNVLNHENERGGVASPLADVDPTTAGEPIVSSCDGCDDILESRLISEEKDSVDSTNITELTTKSGHRTEKMHEEICEANESVSYSLGPRSVPPEIGYAKQDSIPTFEQDDVLDLSSLGFTHTLPAEDTSGLPLYEESMNLMETSQLDLEMNMDGLPEVPAKLTSRRAKSGGNITTHGALDPSPHQQKPSTSNQENGTGRSLRPRKSKTNLCQLVDEYEDDVLVSGNVSEEYALNSAVEVENFNNEEFQVENESKTKKVKRKSGKADDTEKPSRKRKKTREASDQDAGAVRKRFSHSTQRRRVDKILLETPEDEIDYRRVPLRDLILLAEHREKQTKKEAAAAVAQAPKQSNGFYNNEETSNQDGDAAEDTTIFFNYHTYMDRTPVTRWSKQETELFYEAVGQFGTDLSMIQQLFPGRTRRQVKLKYKKEERQHPLRLRDALTNRSKDHSHFKTVIETLKQIAAEENENADKDDLMDLGGNEEADEGISNADKDDSADLAGNEVADEGISNAQDEGDEHIEEEKNEDVANESIEVQNPLEPDDEDDDLFLWSQYRSDT